MTKYFDIALGDLVYSFFVLIYLHRIRYSAIAPSLALIAEHHDAGY